jgi:peptide/nickel transport system substrate-binding protein
VRGRSGRGARRSDRIPLINDPILNPVLAPDIGSVLINKVIFPGLVRPNEQLEPTPDLAESWTHSDDGLTYTFALRPNVKWHDGQPFSARDVKFTFDQITDVNSGSRLRSDFAAVAGVDIVDSLTVRFRLRAPFAPFLALLGYNAGISRSTCCAPEADRGDGVQSVEARRHRPFMVVESARGATRGENPRTTARGWRSIRSSSRSCPTNAQVAQLRAGELDIVPIEPANLASVQGVPGITILQNAVVQHFYVAFNQQRAIFKPALVRRAMEYAVNREAIIAGVLKGTADRPFGTIPLILKAYFDDALPFVPYLPDSAKALLARAGWRADAGGRLHNAAGQPFRFTLLWTRGTREQAALAVQHDPNRSAWTCRPDAGFATQPRSHSRQVRREPHLWTTPRSIGTPFTRLTGQQPARYSNPADSLWPGRATSTARSGVRSTTHSSKRRYDPPGWADIRARFSPSPVD